MTKIAIALAAALAVSGCAGSLPSIDINTTVSRNTILGVESAYGIALSGARSYKALPLCKTGTVFTFTAPCAQRSILVKMQAANRVAISKLKAAIAFTKNYPTVDASNVIAAANAAVNLFQSTVNAATGAQ